MVALATLRGFGRVGGDVPRHPLAATLESGILGAVAQLGERCVRNAEVEGSTPFRSTFVKPCRNKSFCYLPPFGSAAFTGGAKRCYRVVPSKH